MRGLSQTVHVTLWR